MGHQTGLNNGGSGSLVSFIMPLVFDFASGDVGLCVFDLFPLSQYSFVVAEVDVGWCNVVEALMVALVVHEGLDLTF